MTYRDDIKKAGRVVPAIALGLLIAAAVAPACKGVVVETIKPLPPASVGQIGDPCHIDDEDQAQFPGFEVTEENIASGVTDCNSGVCLVNHVQGRSDCPLGQEAPIPCAGPSDTSCGGGASCVPAGQSGPNCYFESVDGGPPQLNASSCASGLCNSPQNTCQCTSDAQCPQGTACNAATKECSRYVCHRVGACQSAGATDAENAGKSCCAGGTDVPVTEAVCGQCEKGSGRNAAEDVYCSCRCGPAEGEPLGDAAYCACPPGFECAQIRPKVGLGDDSLSGKYCIKAGTAFTDESQCGSVSGHLDSFCAGTPAN